MAGRWSFILAILRAIPAFYSILVKAIESVKKYYKERRRTKRYEQTLKIMEITTKLTGALNNEDRKKLLKKLAKVERKLMALSDDDIIQ